MNKYQQIFSLLRAKLEEKEPRLVKELDECVHIKYRYHTLAYALYNKSETLKSKYKTKESFAHIISRYRLTVLGIRVIKKHTRKRINATATEIIEPTNQPTSESKNQRIVEKILTAVSLGLSDETLRRCIIEIAKNDARETNKGATQSENHT